MNKIDRAPFADLLLRHPGFLNWFWKELCHLCSDLQSVTWSIFKFFFVDLFFCGSFYLCLDAFFSPKPSLIENIWPRSTQMTQAAPSSLPSLARNWLWDGVSDLLASTQQVPKPVRNPARAQIGVYGGSSERLRTRHVRAWARKPCKSLDQETQSRTPRLCVRKAYRRKLFLHWKSSKLHIIQTDDVVGVSRCRLGQSMWRNLKHLAILKFKIMGG